MEQQVPLEVFDEDSVFLGALDVDPLIKSEPVLDLKAVKTFASEHAALPLGDLRASKKEHGLHIHLGSPELPIKKYILSQHL